MDFTVTLIGAGNMGGAMLRGWLANGAPAENLAVVDPSPSENMSVYLNEVGIQHHKEASGLGHTDVLLVAVKPQMMGKVLPGLKQLVGPDTVVVSVAAGTTIKTLSQPFGQPAVVRVMPNTPSLIGRSMSVACPNAQNFS